MRAFWCWGISGLLLLAACSKDREPVRGEQPVRQLLSTDTLRDGAFWGIPIGAEAKTVYSALQAIRIPKKLGSLSVVSDSLPGLESIKASLPLYTALYLDQRGGSAAGIQINYQAGRVQSIVRNDGQSLSQWPIAAAASIAIQNGDTLPVLYRKLVTLKKNPLYTPAFGWLALYYKDLQLDYDPGMAHSSQWHCSAVLSYNSVAELTLHFTAGRLTQVVAAVYARQ